MTTITLQYSFLFERFLNPDGISLPDIDIDFIDSRCHEVIQYIKDKYGKDYVAQILTLSNLISLRRRLLRELTSGSTRTERSEGEGWSRAREKRPPERNRRLLR